MSPHADALRRATRRRILRFNRRQQLYSALGMCADFALAGMAIVFAVEEYQALNRLKTIRADTISRWHKVDFLEAHPQCGTHNEAGLQCQYFGDHPELDHLYLDIAGKP